MIPDASPERPPIVVAESSAARRGAVAVLRAVARPAPAVTAAWMAAVALAVAQAPTYALYVVLGLAGAFVAGLVGVGGAILMFPLLLYVPPLAGLTPLAVHTVAAVTMIQVAAAGLAGFLGHLHHGAVRGSIVATLGGGMVVGSLTGAILSSQVSAPALTGVFATLALVAAILMFLPARWMPREIDAAALQFSKPLAVASGLVVGVLVGLVGAGGGFLLIPLMLFLLRIPMRAAVGASLGIVLLSGLAGAAGKIVTGQVDWLLALALVAGALPGAWAGASVSRRTRPRVLGLVLGGVIAVVAVKMWWEILGA